MARRRPIPLLQRLAGWLRSALQAAFIAAAAAAFLAPLAVNLLAEGEAAATGENRALAPWPAPPAALDEVAAWPSRMDAWINDHFGLRGEVVQAAHQVRHAVFREFISPQIVAGRHGRIFLGSHSAAQPFGLLQTSCGWRLSAAEVAGTAQGIGTLLAHPALADVPTDILLVPSAAAIYPNDLPRWLMRQCAAWRPPAARVEAALPAPLRARLHDALPVMADGNLPRAAIPLTNFHWDGVGPDRVAAWLAERRLGLPAMLPMPMALRRKPSDLSHFFPGVELANDIVEADPAAAGIEACYGPPCFAALGGAAATLADLRRYRGPQPGAGRLLLLTDSFGAFAAVWFTRQFGEVWQVSTNNLEQLTPAERARLREVLLDQYRPDRVVLLYHDGSVTFFWDRLLRLLLDA